MLYKNLSGYLRKKYGKRLKKICIDGGFSCPNRDGKCGTGGCIYCGERGSGEHIRENISIKEQVMSAIKSSRDDEEFIAYFQSFTNTYADTETLRARYDEALVSDRIKVLSIGTRPDCIDEEIARLLASYRRERELWVELGLQTSSDKTAEVIRRGYKREVFERALKLLEKYGIPVIVHLIVGLPGESLNDIKKTCEYLSDFELFGIKIHSIYVMRGTELEAMYRAGEYTPPTLEEYIECACYIITHTSPDTVIHRLTGDCPDGLLVAPEWNRNKHFIIGKIEESLKNGNLSQGCFHKKAKTKSEAPQ